MHLHSALLHQEKTHVKEIQVALCLNLLEKKERLLWSELHLLVMVAQMQSTLEPTPERQASLIGFVKLLKIRTLLHLPVIKVTKGSLKQPLIANKSDII
jgi:hypothetical protein